MSAPVSLRRLGLFLAALLVLAGGMAVADPRTRAALQRPFSTGVVVVPDHFLRPWDPVTVFFPDARGPAPGSAEDHPERFVTVSPVPEGAWAWLDGRTLQFRPAEPWPALGRSVWRAGGGEVELVTLMSPPVRTVPDEGASGLDPVEAVILAFPNPIEPASLADMVTVELTPMDGGPTRWLGRRDFDVKALPVAVPEEVDSSDTGSPPPPEDPSLPYELRFKDPLPLGARVGVHLRLSRDDTSAESFYTLSFSTAEPFRISSVWCSGASGVPVAVAGSRYAADQEIGCGSAGSSLYIGFTAVPAGLGPVEARNLVRFSPAVPNLDFVLSGRVLQVNGDFEVERSYELTVSPLPLRDTAGRTLSTTGPTSLWMRWPKGEPYFRWTSGDGVVERTGPRMVPVESRGNSRFDLRLVRVDPLDRGFWPFPGDPLLVDESQRPPGPGEEPEEEEPTGTPSESTLADRIRLAGASLSTLVDVPAGASRGGRFGLDLGPHLDRVAGRQAPGTWLVGLRALDGSSTRAWMRLQVTDLSATVIDEETSARFVITSLATAEPVAGAEVRVEGVRRVEDGREWTTFATGTTGADGSWTWKAPGYDRETAPYLRRVVVKKGEDVLVLDPDRAPPEYTENHWDGGGSNWLGWGFGELSERVEAPRVLGHLFTERPVYRPEEVVHLKGWVRRRDRGRLTPVQGAGTVVVTGPGDLVWRIAAPTSATGGFYVPFQEEKAPTGTYFAYYETADGRQVGSVDFELDSYRIPDFEAVLSGPDSAPLDRPFQVKLTASYYAGGRVAKRPVRWRVTQVPHDWVPTTLPGFLYSSDGRYSGVTGFRSTPRFEKAGVTDADGGATIELDPTIEPTSSPRAYIVEATVTGADDQTVTSARRVVALPPFVLGLRVPRYLETATTLSPELLVAGGDGKLLAGQEVTVRVKRRTWHSVLQASDFSSGRARYQTDVVDELVKETTVTSGAQPLKVDVPLPRSGVYLVELEARDRLGRTQVVTADLYAGGTDAVAWPKPAAGVYTLATDRTSYEPGQTASVVVQSPFATAEALVVVEAPDGNRYSRVAVRGGVATLKIPVERTWAPRVPVHVVLMRGRAEGPGPTEASAQDLGKPTTLAASTALTVAPVENTVKVAVESPPRALPGETVPITVRLRRPDGTPTAGEVTLWLVDAAVLALGKEKRLDPVPDFITAVWSRLSLRDTRNLAFGRIPFAEATGGDAGAEEENPLDRATLRKDFKSVPYYAPALAVGADGNLTVKVKLPDNLTVFKIRAKAAAGPDRFGAGTGEVAVRLPVLVQPALPRFVRAGDEVAVTGIGRVVEGAAGPGTAAVRVEGMKLQGADKLPVTLSTTEPTRFRVAAVVDTPVWTEDGRPSRSTVTVRLGVSRTSDGAADAAESVLPLRPDRAPEVERVLLDMVAGKPAAIPAISEPARPGTIRRTWVASDEAGLVKLAAALDALERSPAGNTDTRLSRARAWLALGELRGGIGLDDPEGRSERAVEATIGWLPQVVSGNGLVSEVPGGRATVRGTASAVQFLVEAQEAGYAVEGSMLRTLTDALRQSLRSDYRYFLDGEAYVERAMALDALAAAGMVDPGYFAELARLAQFRDADGVADTLLAGARAGQGSSPAAQKLVELLSGGLVTRLWQGREVYGGLQTQRTPRSPYVLASESRTVAHIARALSRVNPQHPRLPLLYEALVTLGQGDGWGSTNANAEAVLALVERLRSAPRGRWQADVKGTTENFSLAPSAGAAAVAVTRHGEAATAAWTGAKPGVLRVETTFLPSGSGAAVAEKSEGFVVRRELQLVRGQGPSDKVPVTAGVEVAVKVGTVVEEHVQLVVPEGRHYVLVVVPLAAGLEPLNPRLATAPPEARPAGQATLSPTWTDWRDDQVGFFFESLPKGTYDLYFRTRATVPGRYTQPAATAEALYERAVRGRSAGARVVVQE